MRWAVTFFAFAAAAAAQTPACNYSFSPPNIQLGPLFFSSTIGVFASNGCPWAAQSQNPDWIQVINGSGLGNGTFVLRVLENKTATARRGSVTIPFATLIIDQQQGNCVFFISPPSTRVGPAKGLGTFSISSQCGWVARSDSSWLRLTGASTDGITNILGNGSVVYEYDENISIQPRSAFVSLAPGIGFRLSQDGIACTVTLPFNSSGISFAGGVGAFEVRSNCAWVGRTYETWLSFEDSTIASFTQAPGNATVRFRAQPNPTAETRNGIITVADKIFTVIQGGGFCTYTVFPAALRFTANGGSSTFHVNAQNTCVWIAIPNFPWITAIPGAGYGAGDVTVTISPNTTGADRVGVITLQGTTLGILQSLDPTPLITDVVNGASLNAGPVAPGEIISVKGIRLGPADEVYGEATEDNLFYRTDLSGVKVFVDEFQVPILSASWNKVKVVAPYALSGREQANVRVEYNGLRTLPFRVDIAQANPGIFTLDETGQGQALARVEDYTFITPGNPAIRGSQMILYMTGEGLNSPAGVDGRITGDTLTSPVLGAQVLIGGVPAEVSYVGSTPGQIAGFLQINLKVPFNATVGDAVPVSVTIGQFPAQNGVTVAIR